MKPHILFALVLLAATGAQGWAQEVSPPAGPPATAEAAKEKPRPVSPTVAALLDAAMPKYSPPAADGKNPAPAEVKPQNSIVHLSEYIVREQRAPTDEDIMTRTGREDWAMNTYLGSSHDFDRGVLNHYTLHDLWAKIPVFGKLPFFASTSNSSRAMDRYYDEGLPGQIRDLQQLDSLPGDSSSPKPAAGPAPKP